MTLVFSQEGSQCRKNTRHKTVRRNGWRRRGLLIQTLDITKCPFFQAWHRECFVCTNCQTVLAGQKFASRQDKPYCANCFGELFAKRCTSCSKPITGAGGTRFISFEGRHWHSQCFVCAMCQLSMAGKGFITDGEDIICPDCAKDKLMATSSTGN